MIDGTTLKTATNGSINAVSLATGSGTQLDQGAIPLHLFSRGGSTGINFGSSRDPGKVEVDRQGAGKLVVAKHTTTITLRAGSHFVNEI